MLPITCNSSLCDAKESCYSKSTKKGGAAAGGEGGGGRLWEGEREREREGMNSQEKTSRKSVVSFTKNPMYRKMCAHVPVKPMI